MIERPWIGWWFLAQCIAKSEIQHGGHQQRGAECPAGKRQVLDFGEQIALREVFRVPSACPAEQVRQGPAVVARRLLVRVAAGELVQQTGDIGPVRRQAI